MSKQTPKQPSWPLEIDEVHGPYTPIYETRRSLLQNLTFLIRTIPGEWPGNPDLGVGIEQYIFEQENSPRFEEFKEKTRSQVKKYLPSIEIIKMDFVENDLDQEQNYIVLKIFYIIKTMSVEEIAAFVVSPGKNVLSFLRDQTQKQDLVNSARILGVPNLSNLSRFFT